MWLPITIKLQPSSIEQVTQCQNQTAKCAVTWSAVMRHVDKGNHGTSIQADSGFGWHSLVPNTGGESRWDGRGGGGEGWPGGPTFEMQTVSEAGVEQCH